MSQRIEDQIIEIVKKVTHNSRVDINSTDKSVEGWDSLAYLLIAEKIEDLFDTLAVYKKLDEDYLKNKDCRIDETLLYIENQSKYFE